MIDESCGNYAKEVKSLITKHNRKWDAKHAQVGVDKFFEMI